MNKVILLAAVFAFSSCHFIKSEAEKEWEHYIIRTDSKGNTVKHYLYNKLGAAVCDDNLADKQEYCDGIFSDEYYFQADDGTYTGYESLQAFAAPTGWGDKHNGDCCIIYGAPGDTDDFPDAPPGGYYDMAGHRIPDKDLEGWNPGAGDPFGYVPWPKAYIDEARAAFDASFLVKKVAYAMTRDSIDTNVFDPKDVTQQLLKHVVTDGLHKGDNGYWPLDLYNDLGNEGEGFHFLTFITPSKRTVDKDSTVHLSLGLAHSTKDQYGDSAKLFVVQQEQVDGQSDNGRVDICTYVNIGGQAVGGIVGQVVGKTATKALLGLFETATDAQVVYTVAEASAYMTIRQLFVGAAVVYEDVPIELFTTIAPDAVCAVYRRVLHQLIAHFGGDIGSMKNAIKQGFITFKDVETEAGNYIEVKINTPTGNNANYVVDNVINRGASGKVTVKLSGQEMADRGLLTAEEMVTYVEDDVVHQITSGAELAAKTIGANTEGIDFLLTGVEATFEASRLTPVTEAVATELATDGAVSIATSVATLGVNAALAAESVADITMSLLNIFYHWKDVDDAYVQGGAFIGGAMNFYVYAHPDNNKQDFTNDKTNWRQYQLGLFGLGFGGWKYKCKFHATDGVPSNWVDNVESAMVTSGSITLFDKHSNMLGSASYWGSGIIFGGGKVKTFKIDKKHGY